MGDDFEFSTEQINDLKEHFEHFDTDNDGVISKADLAQVMKALGQSDLTEAKLSEMVTEVTNDAGKDTITFEMFQAHMAKKMSGPPRMPAEGVSRDDDGGQYKRIFDIIDRDEDGSINQGDIEHFVTKWGGSWSAMHEVRGRNDRPEGFERAHATTVRRTPRAASNVVHPLPPPPRARRVACGTRGHRRLTSALCVSSSFSRRDCLSRLPYVASLARASKRPSNDRNRTSPRR